MDFELEISIKMNKKAQLVQNDIKEITSAFYENI
jgi:hypothetical protein